MKRPGMNNPAQANISNHVSKSDIGGKFYVFHVRGEWRRGVVDTVKIHPGVSNVLEKTVKYEGKFNPARYCQTSPPSFPSLSSLEGVKTILHPRKGMGGYYPEREDVTILLQVYLG
jgi:hypothetical protein